MVPRPVRTENLTAPVLFRLVAEHKPVPLKAECCTLIPLSVRRKSASLVSDPWPATVCRAGKRRRARIPGGNDGSKTALDDMAAELAKVAHICGLIAVEPIDLNMPHGLTNGPRG